MLRSRETAMKADEKDDWWTINPNTGRPVKDPNGMWKHRSHHDTAVAAARAEGATEAIEKYALSLEDIPDIAVYGQEQYEQGQRDERERITKAVEAIPRAVFDLGLLDREAVLAVIDGGSDE
jgi:hypothetical protein